MLFWDYRGKITSLLEFNFQTNNLRSEIMTFTPAIDPDIEYPDSDGKPMADNTEQYEWIVKIKENLEILFGWLQEKYESPGNGGWLPFIFGCIAGIVPWLSLVFYVFAIGGPGEAKAPAFVYGVVISIFVLFNTFAIVQ